MRDCRRIHIRLGLEGVASACPAERGFSVIPGIAVGIGFGVGFEQLLKRESDGGLQAWVS